MKKHFTLIFILMYLYFCVTLPCNLNIDETSCLIGSKSIVYSVRNYSLLPFSGLADVSLQKLNDYGGWDIIDNPQLKIDVGYTVGITERLKRNFIIKEGLEEGVYRLTVICDYRLLGFYEVSKEFVVQH